MKLIELMNEVIHDNDAQQPSVHTHMNTHTHTHSPVQPIKSSYCTSAAVTEAPYLLWVAHSL